MLLEMGDANWRSGVKQLARMFARVHAPDHALVDALRLGRTQLRRYKLRGGQILRSDQAYYLGIMANLVTDASTSKYQWDIARLDAKYQHDHELALIRLNSRARRTMETSLV